ncbi:MAG: ornithine carbamoyltransferase [Acidimicrobiia bacterium]|nr:ornithine carbamoyltransferase [Acidimicrobiia bacterium]MDH5502448.1 ornithine carbamoyltransferase [Acidimicrobiia bacterium]
MITDLRGRDLITTQDWSVEELETLLAVAKHLKLQQAMGEPHPLLRDKVLAMLFFFSSTRTRASFEAGMAQLGGHAMFMEAQTTQIAHGDTAKEIGDILGRYTAGLAIRNVDWGVGNHYINEVAKAARVPVLNMQCDRYHPFQALADLLTIMEKKGDPRQLTLNISYAHASSYQKPISVAQSLLLLATRFGMNVRLARPPEFALEDEVMRQAGENARVGGGTLDVVESFEEGLAGADVVYAKSWGALTTATEEESADIGRRYTHWMVDIGQMEKAGRGAIYMHPLPADRNLEVSDEVIDGPQSVVYDQAENRLHVQKAAMALTM